MNWVGFYTLVLYELRRVLRIWKQTLLPPFITTVLYFIVFGTFLGKKIGVIEGVSYMQFLAPGMIILTVITSSYVNVVSSLFGAKYQRSIEELMISPMSNSAIILGYCLAGMFRGFLMSLILFSVASFFTKIAIAHFFLSLFFILLTSFCFSLCGFFNALFAKSFDDIMLIPDFILTPLIYLGGVFYSIDHLPSILQTISRLNPIYYIVRGFRYSLIGINGGFTLIAVAILSTVSCLLFLVNLSLIKKRVGLRI